MRGGQGKAVTARVFYTL